jgi:hypothetical protein
MFLPSLMQQLPRPGNRVSRMWFMAGMLPSQMLANALAKDQNPESVIGKDEVVVDLLAAVERGGVERVGADVRRLIEPKVLPGNADLQNAANANDAAPDVESIPNGRVDVPDKVVERIDVGGWVHPVIKVVDQANGSTETSRTARPGCLIRSASHQHHGYVARAENGDMRNSHLRHVQIRVHRGDLPAR